MLRIIKSIDSDEESWEVYRFLRKFPLEYPKYDEWLKQCRRQLRTGAKRGFVALTTARDIAGSIIFQQKREDRNVFEFKNFRVASEYENNGVGTILLATAEAYAREKRFQRIHPSHRKNSACRKRRNCHQPRLSKRL